MTSDKKKFSLREIIVYVVSLSLSVAFLYFAFSGLDLSSVWNEIAGASVIWTVALVSFQLLSHYLRAVRWKLFLGDLNKEVSVFNLFGAVLIGYGINNVVPRLGEIARAVTASKTENLSKTSVFGSVILERIIDLIIFIFAVMLAGWMYDGDIYDRFSWLNGALYIGTIGFFILLISVILTIKYKEKFYDLILKIAGKFSSKIADKLSELFTKLISGFSGLKTPADYLMMIFWSILIMLAYAATTYSALLALHMDKEHTVTFAMAWVLMSIGSIGNIIPTPGGIGSFHTVAKSVLMNLYNFTAVAAVSCAAFLHGVGYILHSVAAALFILYFRKKVPGLGSQNLLDITKDEKQD